MWYPRAAVRRGGHTARADGNGGTMIARGIRFHTIPSFQIN